METDQSFSTSHGSSAEARSSGHHYHTSAAARSTGQTAMERAQQRKAAHNLMFGTVNRVRSKYHRFQKIINVAGKPGAKRKGEADQQHHSPAKKRAINASLTLTPSPLLLSPQATAKAEQHPLLKSASPLARPEKIVLKGKKLLVKAGKPLVKSEKAAVRSATASSAAISTLQQCHRQDIERKILLQQHHRSRGRLALRLLGKENEASGSGSKASNAQWSVRHGRGGSIASAASRRIAGSASRSGKKVSCRTVGPAPASIYLTAAVAVASALRAARDRQLIASFEHACTYNARLSAVRPEVAPNRLSSPFGCERVAADNAMVARTETAVPASSVST